MGRKTETQKAKATLKVLTPGELAALNRLAARKEQYDYEVKLVEGQSTFFNTESIKGKDLAIVYRNRLNFFESDLRQFMQQLLKNHGVEDGMNCTFDFLTGEIHELGKAKDDTGAIKEVHEPAHQTNA